LAAISKALFKPAPPKFKNKGDVRVFSNDGYGQSDLDMELAYLENSNEEVSGLDSPGSLIQKELLDIQMFASCVMVIN